MFIKSLSQRSHRSDVLQLKNAIKNHSTFHKELSTSAKGNNTTTNSGRFWPRAL